MLGVQFYRVIEEEDQRYVQSVISSRGGIMSRDDVCPVCLQQADRVLDNYGRHIVGDMDIMSIHFSEHIDDGPRVFLHE